MGAKAISLNALAAFVLAVDGLEAARGHVVVDAGAGELALAEGARHEAFLARVQHVIFHHETRDFGAALIQTRDGVFLTHVQVAFEFVQLPTPFAAFILLSKANSLSSCK